MKKTIYALCSVLFCLLLSFGVCTFAIPQKDFSESENRYLEKLPSFSFSSLFSGDYTKSLSSFLSDHFPLREKFVSLQTKLKLLSGKKDIENTYIGKDGFLFEKVTDADIDQKRFENNLSVIEKLAVDNPQTPFDVMLVPSSGCILKNKLPTFASCYDFSSLLSKAQSELSSCNVIDVSQTLKEHQDDLIYYRTDHHWTTRGAYYAYLSYMKKSGSYDDAKKETVTTSFFGTLSSRVPGISVCADSIDVFDLPPCSVSIDGKKAQMYNKDALLQKDKYQVFFGGNHPTVTIKSKKAKKGKILVIKDSFANCFVPFLTEDYSQITMIDLRYYSGSLGALLSSSDFEKVLVLYQMSNFALESSVAKAAL